MKNSRAEANNAIAVLWTQASAAIIAYGRAAKIKIPAFYWDNWWILTDADRREAVRVIKMAYPAEAWDIIEEWERSQPAGEAPRSRDNVVTFSTWDTNQGKVIQKSV